MHIKSLAKKVPHGYPAPLLSSLQTPSVCNSISNPTLTAGHPGLHYQANTHS